MMTGTLAALYCRISGGVIPGGSGLMSVWLSCSDLGDRRLDLGSRLKIDLDDADAPQRLRFQVLDIADGGRHGALDHRRNALLHFGGGEAAVAPDHADHRDIDVGKDVHLHAGNREDADHRDQQGHHDKRVGASKGETDNPHKTKSGLRCGGGKLPAT